MPQTTSTLGRVIRNPLVVFGLVVLAGDGPLVVAYGQAQDTSQGWAVLVALIAFVFGMGSFFCYLVAFKPRHLYAPGEIPESAFGTSIYRDERAEAALAKELENIQARADEKVEHLRVAVFNEIGQLTSKMQGTGDAVGGLRKEIAKQIDAVIERTRQAEKAAQEDKELAVAKNAIVDWFGYFHPTHRWTADIILDAVGKKTVCAPSSIEIALRSLIDDGVVECAGVFEGKPSYRLRRG